MRNIRARVSWTRSSDRCQSPVSSQALRKSDGLAVVAKSRNAFSPLAAPLMLVPVPSPRVPNVSTLEAVRRVTGDGGLNTDPAPGAAAPTDAVAGTDGSGIGRADCDCQDYSRNLSTTTSRQRAGSRGGRRRNEMPRPASPTQAPSTLRPRDLCIPPGWPRLDARTCCALCPFRYLYAHDFMGAISEHFAPTRHLRIGSGHSKG